MPQLVRKRAILAKIETTYGTDSVPTGSADAVLVKNMSITPLSSTVVGRDLIRPFMGEFDQLTANAHVQIQFEVELAGAGTAGAAAPYGALLRACGLSQTLLASALTGTAQAGGANTITLAAGASSVDGVYNGLLVSITGGTGSGQTGNIIAYNGTTKVATVAANWTTPPNATSTYSVGAGATYRPVSGAFESVTIYHNIDGVNHSLTGCRGTVEFSIQANAIPVMRFNMAGIYNTPTDTVLPTPNYAGYQTPLIANNTNTSGFRFFGVTNFVLQNFSLNVNNSVDYRELIGNRYVQLTDRRSNGEVTVEAESMATLNPFTTALNTATGLVSITHGTAAGNRIKIDAPRIDISQPSYEENNGVNMLRCAYVALPTSGNDEFVLAVY